MAHEARVVKHKVHLDAKGIDFSESGLNFGFVLEVTAYGLHLHAIRSKFVNHLFGMALVTTLQDKVRPEFRHFDSDEASDTTASASHQAPFSFYVNHS